MTLDSQHAQAIMDKIAELPPEVIAQVEDFIDFLRQRYERQSYEHGSFASLSTRLSEPVLRRIWDNPQDAAYDGL
jgi:hypothetical protein